MKDDGAALFCVGWVLLWFVAMMAGCDIHAGQPH